MFNTTTAEPERTYKSCPSRLGEVVLHGKQFYPLGYDKCTRCRCVNGEAAMCQSVTCSVPASQCPDGQEALVSKQDCCSFTCVPRGRSIWDSGGGVGGGGPSFNADSSGILTLSVALIAFLLAASFCALLYLLYLNRRRRYELQRALLEQQLIQQSMATASAATGSGGDFLLLPPAFASSMSFAPFKPPHADPPPSYWDIEAFDLPVIYEQQQQQQQQQLVDSDSACSVDCTADSSSGVDSPPLPSL